MERLIIPELEKAATTLMAPPQAVSSEARQSAEQIFLEFRKTKQPYNICRFILENCQVDYVLFEAATTLKEAVIREWNLLQKQDVDSLCTFLLNYVTHHKSLQKFVCEQILQVVAMIFKRGTLDKSAGGCGDLLKSVAQLLHSGDVDMQMVCCSIMKALLTEYSSNSQSSNLGLSLEYHAECKKAFENGNLLTIFLLCQEILKKFADNRSTSLSRTDIALFIRYLSLAEQVLNWNFVSGNPLQLLRLPNDTAKINLFVPPKTWRPTIMDPDFISLFVKLYNRCTGHDELTHHCLQCLIQLASVRGPIFFDQQSKMTYLTCLIQGLMQLMNRNTWTSMEAFGYASIISRIVNVFPIASIASLPPEVLKSFSGILASLTCSFLELSVSAGETDFDTTPYEDAVDLLLDGWVVLVSNLSNFTDNYFVPYAIQVFSCYLKTHLARPDGIRRDDDDGNEIGEIDCDVEEDDRIAYADELSNIGCLARLALPYVLPSLAKLIESRTNSLVNSMKENGGQNIDALFEDIHWLLLIVTNVIMMDCNDNEASIPTDVLMYESQQQQHGVTDMQTSCRYMSNLGRNCSSDKVSCVLLLMSEVFKLAEYICAALKNGMANHLSPEITSDVLWFFQCWASSYLFPTFGDDNIVPELFKFVFGEGTQCGTLLLGFSLDVAEAAMTHMPEEPTVAYDSVQLLLKIFCKEPRIRAAMDFPNLWRLAYLQAKKNSQLQKLPVDVHRHLVEALMKAGSHVKDSGLREKFLATFLGQFQSSYEEIKKQQNFDIFQQETFRQKVVSLLESMRGITSATNRRNAELIFQFLSTYLADIPFLLEKYSNNSDIVELILELFVDVIRTEIIYLDKEKSNTLCGLCVQVITNYSKHNLGRIRALHSSEDESYQEILLLIRLLTHILSKDYLDFSYDFNGATDDGVMLNAIDAVFHGLRIILPLMSEELLKFPKLSTEYFKLVTFVCERYPEKIESLPEDLFSALTKSLEMALLHFDSDIAKNSLEALASIAENYVKAKTAGKDTRNHVDASLQHFLKVVFQFILSSSFDMDLLQAASETLFKLICPHQREYMAIAHSLLENQTNQETKERLRTSFSELTPTSLKLSVDKASVATFRKYLEKFLLDVKGFLFVK